MKAVLLAAGVGSRLGRPFPKSLVKLPDGERILGRQIRTLREKGIHQVYVVVGFKMDLIMEEFPDVFFRYNPFYYITNTSKSLLCALKDLDDDVIWLNGDVIADPEVLSLVLANKDNVAAVDRKKCGPEEVKYTADKQDFIREISKTVHPAHGEAVGINKICREDLPMFVSCLQDCADEDFFEKAMEKMIERKGRFRAVDISEHRCIEVDFEDDLRQALDMFSG